jgi:small subunit ribosomal protein S9
VSTEAKTKFIWGTGRRKSAVARVRLQEGSGNLTVNGRSVEEYFSEDKQRQDVLAPLVATDTRSKLDFFVSVSGGGITGQAGAVMLGIARALKKYSADFDKALRDGGFLTRDSRMKERKKYGKKAARRSFQFSKR